MALFQPGTPFASHLAGIIGPRMIGDHSPRFVTDHTDGHPDPLFAWEDHGRDTPMGWFELCAFTGTGHVLFVQRTAYMDAAHAERAPLGNKVLAGSWWHPSPEYVREIGRQMLDGSRWCFAWNITQWHRTEADAIEIRERVPGGFRIVAQLPTAEERKRYREETT